MDGWCYCKDIKREKEGGGSGWKSIVLTRVLARLYSLDFIVEELVFVMEILNY